MPYTPLGLAVAGYAIAGYMIAGLTGEGLVWELSKKHTWRMPPRPTRWHSR